MHRFFLLTFALVLFVNICLVASIIRGEDNVIATVLVATLFNAFAGYVLSSDIRVVIADVRRSHYAAKENDRVRRREARRCTRCGSYDTILASNYAVKSYILGNTGHLLATSGKLCMACNQISSEYTIPPRPLPIRLLTSAAKRSLAVILFPIHLFKRY